MKKLFALLALLAALRGTAFAQGAPRAKKTLPFSKGVNFPVWMEFSRMNALLYSKKDFENAKSMGVEAIRLPVWFELWNEGAPGYAVSQECFDIIDAAVSWCEELGMHIIIDFHNDCGGNSKTNPKIEQILLKVWPQVAERYKNRGSRVVYEIMNEPHFSSGNTKADCAKWAKIQGNVLKAIRAVDKTHAVIVGGGDWNSIDSMLALPDYADDNLIYNFHDYSPMLFTHQGAAWTFYGRFTGIPFPYEKDKMPAPPKNLTAQEKAALQGYPKDSSKEALCAPLDKAVEFADKRGAALMCDEFGVSMLHADPAERVNWYRLKCAWMDERGICRISWDWTQEFGVFSSTARTRFPQDLNAPLVQAMGYAVPQGTAGESWLSAAKKSGVYSIYKNGSAPLITVSGSGAQGSLLADDSGEKCVLFGPLAPYAELAFDFGEPCDFTALKDSGARLEFQIKSEDKPLALSVYFRDSEAAGFPWRAAQALFPKNAKADGKWHAVSIPLNAFYDAGGWSQKDGWKNGEGKFSWKGVGALVFQNGNAASKAGCMIKDIRIAR